jgi:UDP-2,4-diacetamido-2,4,6-trideoxy-beta-L-altropyranose hydrolase
MTTIPSPEAPRLVVRADASLTIGMGHLVRSLALAEVLHVRGWAVSIASRSMPADTRDEIVGRGYDVIPLGPGSFDSEPAQIAAALPPNGAEVAVVDHYELLARWHSRARAWSRLVIAIDDLAAGKLDVDVVVNQNLGEEESSYDRLAPPHARRLVGPRFALLRRQFAEQRGDGPRVRRSIQRILVAMSGSDEGDVTRIAAEAIAGLGLEADVVVGAAYPKLEALQDWAADVPSVTLHRNVSDMAALMHRADLAVGAPGSASWERCSLGLPAVTITLAANQVRAAGALHDSGAAISLGWHADVDGRAITRAVEGLAQRPERLSEMSRAAALIVDGEGAGRVADVIEVVTRRGETR